MFNVKQAARYAGVSGTTIRGWTREYADYLSPSANPPAGQARQFDEDDLAVFATIATLRDQLVTTAEIRGALDAGRRLEPVRPPEEEPATAEQPTGDQSAATAAGALAIWSQQVNALQAKNEILSDRLIEAERRIADERVARAAAERELEILRALYESATSAAADSTPGRESPRPTFWQWLTSRGRS